MTDTASALDRAGFARQDLAMSPNDPPILPEGPRRVEVLAFPSVQLLDVAGPLQVFSSANERAAEQGGAPLYNARVIAPEAQVGATAGLVFSASALPAREDAVDTLVIAGGQGVRLAAQDLALVDWLRGRAERARRVASVCTGAFLLGAAGLLDGRRAVTHWEYCPELQRSYPRAHVDPDPIFIEDRGVWTSAGVTSGIDLALALVEEDHGRALALAVARQLVVFLKRPGGQAQFSETLALQSADDRFAPLHAWIAGHLEAPLTLAQMAAEAGMSERSFARHYREATGLTPRRAVERLRVEAARQLLTASDLPFKRIAARCGFGTEETMRRSFLRVQGVGPQAYRGRFGA